MLSDARTTQELIQLAASGAGFVMAGNARTTQELVQIAVAAKNGGGIVYIQNLAARTTAELIQIGAAGKGHVVLSNP